MTTPNTQKRRAQFRGPLESTDYNKRIEENYRDLTLLFNRARLSEVELDELYRRMAKDQLAMADAINELEQRVRDLESESSSFYFNGQDSLEDHTLFDGVAPVDSADLLTYDTLHNVLILPYIKSGSFSKLTATNPEGRQVVPPSFSARVEGLTGSADTPAALIDSNDPKFALYRKPGLIWERNVVVDSSNAKGAELTIYMKLPQEIQTSEKANNIVLHPFPFFHTTIKDISTSSALNPTLTESDGYTSINASGFYSGEDKAVGWVVPGGWSGNSEGDDAVVEAGPKSFYFPERDVTAVKITLHQPDYYLEDSKFVYTYGLTHVDVRKNSFLPTGKAFIKVEAAEGRTISSIDSVEPEIFNINPSLIPQAFSYRVFWDNGGTPSLNEQALSSHVWIEVTLNEVNGTTPVLNSMQVQYS